MPHTATQKPSARYGKGEGRRQDQEWGGPEHDDTHTNSDWMGFIGLQIGRTSTGITPYREAMVKIAALAVAAIESHDRIEGQKKR